MHINRIEHIMRSDGKGQQEFRFHLLRRAISACWFAPSPVYFSERICHGETKEYRAAATMTTKEQGGGRGGDEEDKHDTQWTVVPGA